MDEGRFSRIETYLFLIVVSLTAAASVGCVLFFARALQLLAFILKGKGA